MPGRSRSCRRAPGTCPDEVDVVALVLDVDEPVDDEVPVGGAAAGTLTVWFRYSSGEPRPKMQDTLATMRTSLR